MTTQPMGTSARAVAGRGEAGPASAEASASRPGSAPPATSPFRPGTQCLSSSWPQNSGMTPGTSSPLATRIMQQLSVEPQIADIVRSLGYPPVPEPSVLRSVENLLAEAHAFLQPRGTYALYQPAKLTERPLAIGGELVHGDIGEFLRGASRVAVFMVTVGNQITFEAKSRSDSGDVFGGRALDIIGSWATELTMDALMATMSSELGSGESFTARYSPGFCGMDLDEQRVLFRLAPAGNVGISLLPSLFMEPLKSISGIVGLGPRELVGIHLSPCERCPLVNCHLRR